MRTEWVFLAGLGIGAIAGLMLAPQSGKDTQDLLAGNILRLLNAADNSARPAAPGSLLSVVGQRVNEATAGGLNYPVWNTAGTDSQIQVPFEAVGPTVALALRTAAGTTVDRDLRVQPVSPAILVNRDGLPALFDADSGMPIGTGNAAHTGQRIQIMATGLGKVRPDWITGRPALC